MYHFMYFSVSPQNGVYIKIKLTPNRLMITAWFLDVYLNNGSVIFPSMDLLNHYSSDGVVK